MYLATLHHRGVSGNAIPWPGPNPIIIYPVSSIQVEVTYVSGFHSRDFIACAIKAGERSLGMGLGMHGRHCTDSCLHVQVLT